ncbi:hypothetical protein [Cellulomonas sp. KRMCY2]|uniref:hypothetical protein n=1 Tax=Cellulomonas sp. KRMCY2 TaxID=1304865 RepID=UPI00045E73D1|nr:hypothetical protein [Cellulomonas sp. KRMCY2]
MNGRRGVVPLVLWPLAVVVLAVACGVGVGFLLGWAWAPRPGEESGPDAWYVVIAAVVGVAVAVVVWLVGLAVAARRLVPSGRRGLAFAVAVTGAIVGFFVVVQLGRFVPVGGPSGDLALVLSPITWLILRLITWLVPLGIPSIAFAIVALRTGTSGAAGPGGPTRSGPTTSLPPVPSRLPRP